uniref:C-type lectin domain-containing protein n=1 Tax=Sinocyclocheilus anshuiensis TaxID=1608454 RepID=A0A671R6P6_9TELE
CLVLLCVLLLTAVIVLCVHIYTNCTQERDQLIRNTHLTEEREQLLTTIKALKDQLRWKCYQSSLFYLSSERTSWTESRRYCTERGANLIIINNRRNKKWSDKDRVWIGLTDSDVEGRWKWVDGSTLTSGFWMSAEPDGYRGENCALTVVGEWADHPCTEEFNWMCERSTV